MFKIKNKGDTPNPPMKTSQKLHTAISMLALTVIALTTATYAWFTLSASTRVRDIEVDVTAGANLKIAVRDLGSNVDDYFDEVLGIDDYHTPESDDALIDYWMQHYSDSKIPLRDIKLSPRTSGDGENFYTQNGTSPQNTPNLASGSYMEFELWLISSDDMRVHLSTVDDDEGVWTHIEAIANENGQTLDQIEECIRVAFWCEDDGRMVIWEPNKESGATPAFNASHPAWTGGTVETVELPAHNVEGYDDDTWICELTADQQKQVIVRVWLEGEDPQGVDAVQRARFNMELRFQGTDENNDVLS